MQPRRHRIELIIPGLRKIIGLAVARQIHRYAAKPVAQPRDNGLPDAAVPAHAMEENNRRAIALIVKRYAVGDAVPHAIPEAPFMRSRRDWLPRHPQISLRASGARYRSGKIGFGRLSRQPVGTRAPKLTVP